MWKCKRCMDAFMKLLSVVLCILALLLQLCACQTCCEDCGCAECCPDAAQTDGGAADEYESVKTAVRYDGKLYYLIDTVSDREAIEKREGELVEIGKVKGAVGADRLPEQDGYTNHGGLIDCPMYASSRYFQDDCETPVEFVYILRQGVYWYFRGTVYV